jgi:prevent-host-death family protein
MPTIPQRELRNNVSQVLRRAERGERFTVTVDGRPVAELGPLGRPQRLAPPERLGEIIRDAPVDPGWAGDLARMRADDASAARNTFPD